MSKVHRQIALGELVQRFVDFMEDHHAELVGRVDKDVARAGTLYAAARFEGAAVFIEVAGFPEDLIEILYDARDRYVALLGGASEVEFDRASLQHALVVRSRKAVEVSS